MGDDIIQGRALTIIDSLCTALLEVGKRWAETQRELAEMEHVADALRRQQGELASQIISLKHAHGNAEHERQRLSSELDTLRGRLGSSS